MLRINSSLTISAVLLLRLLWVCNYNFSSDRRLGSRDHVVDDVFFITHIKKTANFCERREAAA